MRFLLLHSPLVSKETWTPLVTVLEAAGSATTVVTLDNSAHQDRTMYEHHLDQIESAVADLKGQAVIAVAHSGAGNLLALVDPKLIRAYVFLDAIFPLSESSRFDLFDAPAAVQSWRSLASQHRGVLPRAMLARFGDQVLDPAVRYNFVAGLTDVPIQLFEERIPVNPEWPPSEQGLYVQWTDSYSADAGRAKIAGFEVRSDPASHFKMLNQPDDVACMLIDFASDLRRVG